MRKLIIQIPCLNEEASLPISLAALPREVIGFDQVEWLVIDDGSTDRTAEVAVECGVDYVLKLGHRQGLARAFMAGLSFALQHGADVIVNTDADNQYDASCIPVLVKPILDGRALIVVGARPISAVEHFSLTKKMLQRLGSWAVKVVSQTTVSDAPSGFRAIHKDAAIQLNVFNRYTYTLETIIQAGRRGIPIISIPIRVNGFLRPSRLVSSISSYVSRSLLTILRVFIIYKPALFFITLALISLIPASMETARFLFAYILGRGQGHVQSLVLSAGLFAVAAIFAVSGVLADLLATNRILLEDIKINALRQQIKSTPGSRAEDDLD